MSAVKIHFCHVRRMPSCEEQIDVDDADDVHRNVCEVIVDDSYANYEFFLKHLY